MPSTSLGLSPQQQRSPAARPSNELIRRSHCRPAQPRYAQTLTAGFALAAGILHLVACAVPGPAAPPPGALDQLAAEVQAWVKAGEIVGAEVIVMQSGDLLLHKAFGFADKEHSVPMVKNGVISVKSMTKPVTATAVLMLADEGRLSLDDTLTKYIPEYAGDPRVTLHDLLSHTSGDDGGFGGGGYNVYDFPSLAAWVEDWAVQKPAGTYGKFAYSNFNYAALGYVVEVVTKAPLELFLQDRILTPLGMDETWAHFTPEAEWAARVPVRYRWNFERAQFEGFWRNTDAQPWSFFPAGFGLWMTGLDYAKFARLWLNRGRHEGKALLSKARVDEALGLHAHAGGTSYYGFGWFVERARTTDGRPVEFRHGGADGSVGLAFPASDAVVLLLTQSQSPFFQGAFHNRVGMLGLFDHPGPNMEWARERDVHEAPLDAAARSRYVGSYVGQGDGPPMGAHVSEGDSHLTLALGPQGRPIDIRQHLIPLGEHRFGIGRYEGGELVGIDPAGSMRFVLEDGEVNGLVAEYDGAVELVATRVPGPH